jgi:two-component system NtrC family sensor kinase
MRDFYRPAREGLQPTYLHAVLESVLELTSKQLQHSQVTVERVWADYIPEIQANPDHLKQVFLNLVLNAVDAMPTGGTLYISTGLDQIQRGEDQQSLPAVRVEFSDTGEGIPSEVVSRLFEPFFTTKEGGTGLGLSISYGIIQAHNGQITVESHTGMGTTFTILLPVEQPSG